MDGGDTSHVDMVEELFQILKCTTVVVVLYISGIWRWVLTFIYTSGPTGTVVPVCAHI